MGLQSRSAVRSWRLGGQGSEPAGPRAAGSGRFCHCPSSHDPAVL